MAWLTPQLRLAFARPSGANGKLDKGHAQFATSFASMLVSVTARRAAPVGSWGQHVRSGNMELPGYRAVLLVNRGHGCRHHGFDTITRSGLPGGTATPCFQVAQLGELSELVQAGTVRVFFEASMSCIPLPLTSADRITAAGGSYRCGTWKSRALWTSTIPGGPVPCSRSFWPATTTWAARSTLRSSSGRR